MKSPNHTAQTPQEGATSPQQIASWSLILRQWQSRLAPYFARPKVLADGPLLYLQAILSDIPRKNGRQIAEQARQALPQPRHETLALARRLGPGRRARRGAPLRLPDLALAFAQVRLLNLTPLSRCWSLMKAAFPKRGSSSASASGDSIAASAGAWRTVKWVSFSPRHQQVANARRPCCTCPKIGVLMRYADTMRISRSPSALRPNPNSRSAWLGGCARQRAPCRWVGLIALTGTTDLRTFLEAHALRDALAVPSIEVIRAQTPA